MLFPEIHLSPFGQVWENASQNQPGIVFVDQQLGMGQVIHGAEK
jgi:hypothetical protein